jgi:hypothetical protein
VKKKGLVWFLIGLLLTVTVAVVVSRFASSEPDGLEYVAEREGFAGEAADHPLADAPLAGYGENLPDEGFPVGIAGLIGVLATLGVAFGLFWIIRTPGSGREGPPE